MKISKYLVLKWIILINLVKVLSGEEAREAGCPEIMRKLIKIRGEEQDFCQDIACEGLTVQDCQLIGTEFENGLTMCGCCPGCAKYLDEGASCGVGGVIPPSLEENCTTKVCPINKNECKPGLVCNYLGEPMGVCLKDTAKPEPIEDGTKRDCEYLRNLYLAGILHWAPVCEGEFFAPRQCKVANQEGFCYCVDAVGNRIFGREWWDKAENQTCACSRHANTLREQGYVATVHCSSDGNYDPLQCDMDSHMCYCVDTKTGELTGGMLLEHQWKLLPCYSADLTDGDPTGQYLRICESEWGGGQLIKKEGFLHGHEVYAVSDFKCDFDGSFGPVRRNNEMTYCVPKTGKLEESRGHFQELGRIPLMTCKCFRDSLIYEEESRPFLKHCDLATGNYDAISEFDQVTKEYRCVDEDGMYFGDIVPSSHRCCLLGEGACDKESETIRECLFPGTNNKITSCADWTLYWQ